jgi:hypothetical protein
MLVSECFTDDLFGQAAQIECSLQLAFSTADRRQISESRGNLWMLRSQTLFLYCQRPPAQPLRLRVSSLACVDGRKAIESLRGYGMTFAQRSFTNRQDSAKSPGSFVQSSFQVIQDGQIM